MATARAVVDEVEGVDGGGRDVVVDVASDRPQAAKVSTVAARATEMVIRREIKRSSGLRRM
jgi:hypothetical protein